MLPSRDKSVNKLSRTKILSSRQNTEHSFTIISTNKKNNCVMNSCNNEVKNSWNNEVKNSWNNEVKSSWNN